MLTEYYFCSPTELRLNAQYNPWMAEATTFAIDAALEQYEKLVSIFKLLAPGYVYEVPPKEKLTELCFLGDSLFAINSKALYSRFSVAERFPETDYVIEVFTRLGFEGSRVPENVFYEGSGETMLLGETILVGFGVRSHREVVRILEAKFERPVRGIELANPRFHHLDTALLPLRPDLAICYPGAMTPHGLHELQKLDCQMICLQDDEIEPFCLNAVVIGDAVIIDAGARKMHDRLHRLGFQVYPVDTSEFIKFGASVKCLTFQHLVLNGV